MQHTDRPAIAVPMMAWLCALLALVSPARAATDSPERAVVVLVGELGGDPTLFARVRSLFDASTRVELVRQRVLATQWVLEPPEAGSIYLFLVRSSKRTARIYLSLRAEGPEPLRYLLREVDLASGLDEVGSETLAQMAHSAATALWAREAEVPRAEVEARLVDERQSEDKPRILPTHGEPKGPFGKVTVPHYAFTAELGWGAHVSGDEGWSMQPTGGLGILRDHRLSLRFVGHYVLPHDFSESPHRLRVNGFGAEARLGFFVPMARWVDWVSELGSGFLSTRWESESHAQGRDQRGYLLGAIAARFPLSPFWAEVGFDLRLPFDKISYDEVVGDQRSPVAESWLSPGIHLRLGGTLTRF